MGSRMQFRGRINSAWLEPMVVAAAAAASANGATANAGGADGAVDANAHHHMPPARMREYAQTFEAAPEWQHYTGTLAASQTVQRAFDVYRGNQMDHSPATLIRAAPGAPWTRLDGFATAAQMLANLSDLSQLHAAR